MSETPKIKGLQSKLGDPTTKFIVQSLREEFGWKDAKLVDEMAVALWKELIASGKIKPKHDPTLEPGTTSLVKKSIPLNKASGRRQLKPQLSHFDLEELVDSALIDHASELEQVGLATEAETYRDPTSGEDVLAYYTKLGVFEKVDSQTEEKKYFWRRRLPLPKKLTDESDLTPDEVRTALAVRYSGYANHYVTDFLTTTGKRFCKITKIEPDDDKLIGGLTLDLYGGIVGKHRALYVLSRVIGQLDNSKDSQIARFYFGDMDETPKNNFAKTVQHFEASGRTETDVLDVLETTLGLAYKSMLRLDYQGILQKAFESDDTVDDVELWTLLGNTIDPSPGRLLKSPLVQHGAMLIRQAAGALIADKRATRISVDFPNVPEVHSYSIPFLPCKYVIRKEYGDTERYDVQVDIEPHGRSGYPLEPVTLPEGESAKAFYRRRSDLIYHSIGSDGMLKGTTHSVKDFFPCFVQCEVWEEVPGEPEFRLPKKAEKGLLGDWSELQRDREFASKLTMLDELSEQDLKECSFEGAYLPVRNLHHPTVVYLRFRTTTGKTFQVDFDSDEWDALSSVFSATWLHIETTQEPTPEMVLSREGETPIHAPGMPGPFGFSGPALLMDLRHVVRPDTGSVKQGSQTTTTPQAQKVEPSLKVRLNDRNSHWIAFQNAISGYDQADRRAYPKRMLLKRIESVWPDFADSVEALPGSRIDYRGIRQMWSDQKVPTHVCIMACMMWVRYRGSQPNQFEALGQLSCFIDRYRKASLKDLCSPGALFEMLTTQRTESVSPDKDFPKTSEFIASLVVHFLYGARTDQQLHILHPKVVKTVNLIAESRIVPMFGMRIKDINADQFDRFQKTAQQIVAKLESQRVSDDFLDAAALFNFAAPPLKPTIEGQEDWRNHLNDNWDAPTVTTNTQDQAVSVGDRRYGARSQFDDVKSLRRGGVGESAREACDRLSRIRHHNSSEYAAYIESIYKPTTDHVSALAQAINRWDGVTHENPTWGPYLNRETVAEKAADTQNINADLWPETQTYHENVLEICGDLDVHTENALLAACGKSGLWPFSQSFVDVADKERKQANRTPEQTFEVLLNAYMAEPSASEEEPRIIVGAMTQLAYFFTGGRWGYYAHNNVCKALRSVFKAFDFSIPESGDWIKAAVERFKNFNSHFEKLRQAVQEMGADCSSIALGYVLRAGEARHTLAEESIARALWQWHLGHVQLRRNEEKTG